MADWIIDKKDVKSTVDGDFVLYKNRPLVREDNVICYGSMEDKYILQMIIMSEKEYKGTMVPDKVYVQLSFDVTSTDQLSNIIKSIRKINMVRDVYRVSA